MGRAGEAIQLYEQVLADADRVLGPDHQLTAIVRNKFAQALFPRTG
ncbi:tetratricopeptide repeat protein [Nocardia niwae]|uniref:Tetratricopeptide repeat protein n=1 Tax=Nocardia niwae TaxID=626084 RepID=A0ABV2X4J7_9NOCA